MFQLNRSAIEVAEILQALLERVQIWRFFFGVSRVPQNADSRHSFALLRPRLEHMTSDPLTASSGAHLIVETESNPEHIRFLEESLHEFNVQATGIPDGTYLGVFLRAADGSIVGGAFGWTWGGTCHVRYLFVAANVRNQGRGTGLMRAVEKEARTRNCRQIVVKTHDFQAPRFYEKLGLEVVGHVADYPRGHQYLTLVKRIA